MFPYLNTLIFVPVVAAAVIALYPSDASKRLVRGSGRLVSVALLIISIVMATRFKSGVGGFQMVSTHSWIPTFGISWSLGIDGISLVLILLTTFLFVIAMFGATEKRDEKSYVAWMILLEAACIGSFLAIDLFGFFVLFELTLIPTYFLIGGWGYKDRGKAAIKFFVYTFLGSAFLLIGILALVFIHQAQTGVLTFELPKLVATAMSSATAKWLFLAFTAAFAVKAPIFPFHTWSPDAYGESPTGTVMILSGVMAKLGTYGIIRFDFQLFPQAAKALSPLLLTLAVIGIVYGAIVAAGEKDLKRLVAYSSLSHMGFIVLGLFALSTEGISGAVLQMVNHGLYTAAMFLLVGLVYERRNTTSTLELSGIQAKAPIFAGVFTVVVMASIGLPGLNGFVGEFLILLGTFATHRWWAVVATTGVILSAIYFLWAYQKVFHRKDESDTPFLDLRRKELAVMAPVLLLIVFIGIYPKPFLDRINPSVYSLMNQMSHTPSQTVVVGSSAPAAVTK